MTLTELKKKIEDCGVVGAGGAGFPSAFKYSEDADTLIINAAECEPLIYTDYYILKTELSKVSAAAEVVMDACKMTIGYLSLKSHTAERLGFSDGELIGNKLRVKVLPNVYPMGDEIILIYETCKKVIAPGALPISEGVIVNNVETLYNIYNAVYGGEAVTEKWLTIGGEVEKPLVIKAYIGTPVSELFSKLNIEIPDGYALIDGGPAMGNIVNPATAVITKTTKALLILPKTAPAVAKKIMSTETALKHASSCCCSCSRCSDLCPRHLVGYSLEPHKIIRAANSGMIDPELYKNAQLCSACGICEIVACCNGLSPKRVYTVIKGLMAKNKIRYTHDGSEVKPYGEREYRMIPSDRFMMLLGVKKYDKMPEYLKNFEYMPERAELKMKWHVGAPATPKVKPGDFVCHGDIIGKASDGISANIHSPIDGKVISADKMQVVIGN